MTSAAESADLRQTITLGTIFQRNGSALPMINAREPGGIKKLALIIRNRHSGCPFTTCLNGLRETPRG